MKTLPPYLIRESNGAKIFLKEDGLYHPEPPADYKLSYEECVSELEYIDPNEEVALPTHNISSAFYATIFMAGDISVAKKVCQEECDREGLCVTVEPTTYIYTGGSEEGFRIGFINYARFPSKPQKIIDRARKLAKLLLERCAQTSFSIVTPNASYYWSKRDRA